MPKTFVTTRRIQFAETDLAGVLHFSNYYRLMEEAEHAFWRSIGESVVKRDGEREIGWPRASTSCDYFAPASFEDELQLTLTIAKVSDQSVMFEVQFRRGNERLAVGRMTVVCCALEQGGFRPIPIPDSIREKLTQ